MSLICEYQRSFLLPANKVWGKVIFSEACVKNSVHGGGCGIPACLAGLEGCEWVSQHALQVSWPTPKGELGGSGQGRLQALTRGSSGPHLGKGVGVSQHALR